MPGLDVADRETMFGLRDSNVARGRTVPVSIGPGGFAPVLFLAAVFGFVGARAGLPVAMAALLGGIGGTASLLVHELGHVRAARRLAGIRSANVSLIWLGAATRFEGAYANGREQLKVAIAGPQASFLFALTLLAAAFLPMPFAMRELMVVLVLFNLAIGALNLVPAYPLDGHKLAVGLLWCATGSEKKARRILRRIGFGWAALELPAGAFLLIERPQFGLAVIVMAASFFAQKHLVRKPVAATTGQ